jgi:hypothetical protein
MILALATMASRGRRPAPEPAPPHARWQPGPWPFCEPGKVACGQPRPKAVEVDTICAASFSEQRCLIIIRLCPFAAVGAACARKLQPVPPSPRAILAATMVNTSEVRFYARWGSALCLARESGAAARPPLQRARTSDSAGASPLPRCAVRTALRRRLPMRGRLRSLCL